MDKYRRLRASIVSSEAHRSDVLIVPPAANDDQLLLCHTPRYVDAVKTGSLSEAEIRRIGFPWSPKMVERSRRSTGATCAAARVALQDTISVNLAGGTHHAMPGVGEGYCVFNDAAVAIRTLQQDGLVGRACVIDLDVHQGNGTAEIFSDDHSVFTLSIHGDKNFPSRKHPSDLDIALPDQTGDSQYVSALSQAFAKLENNQAAHGKFDLAIYLAGADPFIDDRLGRLALSIDGLRQRDALVIQWCHQNSIPAAIAMAGGYAADIDKIVEIHAGTVMEASRHFAKIS